MLQGVKVVEFASMIAAPAATGLLAEWGAEVIKIEPHSGDRFRGDPAEAGSANFDLHNRGKRSLTLDTNAPETRDIILKLVAAADIFVTNVLPEQIAKLRLEWADLRAVNPRLVYASVSSLGRAGEEQNRGATDNLSFWGRGGGTALLTLPGDDPIPVRQGVGDRVTGLAACAGMLAALLDARQSGQGRFIDTSLLSAGVWCFGTDMINYVLKGRTAPSRTRRDCIAPLANYFQTRDGRWLQLGSDLASLARAFDRLDLIDDPRFQGRAQRDNRGALVDLMDSLFGAHDYDDVKVRLDREGVKFEPVQTVAEVLEDLQVIATGQIADAAGKGRSPKHVRGPAMIVGDDGLVLAEVGELAPLGRDSIAILRELGYGEADLERMRANGTVKPGAV